MAKNVRVLVLRAAGTNCDEETKYAFEKAGATGECIHVNRVLERPALLDRFHILVIPGGFTYGDDIASGKVLANQLRFNLAEAVSKFIDDGKLAMGICNGFQVFVKAGLLPGLKRGELDATLTNNDSNRFEDRWIYMKANASRCVFVKPGEDCYLPVAHGEGKFLVKDESILRALRKNGQVVFQYTDAQGRLGAGFPWNPNGSLDDIAGICDPTGRIFGLMPHPERHVEPTQHPRWTREGLKKQGDGLIMIQNGVRYVRRSL
jgi:phosphoribosylformylglycinamidine synthase